MKHLAQSMWGFLLVAFVGGPADAGPADEKTAGASKADVQELVKGNNEFAFDLYRRLSEKEGNIVFSPYSISTALAMTYGGARGETAKEMAKVLHFSLPEERLHSACGELIGRLEEEKDRQYQLYVANALWGQEGYPFLDSFLDLGKNHYRAGLQELDFAGHTEKARLTINRWIEQHTKDKIKELLGRDDLSSLTRLILTNAIYFKAAWAMPFPKSQTNNGLFETAPSEKVAVDMMHSQEAPFKYFAADNCEWLELPYTGDRMSMILLLPQKGRWAEFEKRLTAPAVQEGIGKLKYHLGKVAVPRFKVSSAARLREELSRLGLRTAFSDDADFAGMVGGRELKVGNVIHQAFLSVDELGSEAAAATAVEMLSSEFPTFAFTADRAFFFLIRDNQTGSILFLGRVVRPGKVS